VSSLITCPQPALRPPSHCLESQSTLSFLFSHYCFQLEIHGKARYSVLYNFLRTEVARASALRFCCSRA
jgi:hypothetical protein